MLKTNNQMPVYRVNCYSANSKQTDSAEKWATITTDNSAKLNSYLISRERQQISLVTIAVTRLHR